MANAGPRRLPMQCTVADSKSWRETLNYRCEDSIRFTLISRYLGLSYRKETDAGPFANAAHVMPCDPGKQLTPSWYWGSMTFSANAV